MSKDRQDVSFNDNNNCESNNAQNESNYSTLEKGCRKATKKLSQLFHKNEHDKDGFCTKLLKKIKRMPKSYIWTNEKQSKEYLKKSHISIITKEQGYNFEQQHLIDNNNEQVSHQLQVTKESNKELINLQPIFGQLEKKLPLTEDQNNAGNSFKDDLNEWLAILVNSSLFSSTEDTKQNGTSYSSTPLKPQLLQKSFNDSNEPIVNVLQPPNRHEKKPFVISNSHYPEQPNTNHQPTISSLYGGSCNKSLLSAQLQQHDEVKERLDIAAAKRNAIKQNRLKEQMNLAWFETMDMIKSHDINSQSLSNDILYQKLQMNTRSEASSSKDVFNEQPEILIW